MPNKDYRNRTNYAYGTEEAKRRAYDAGQYRGNQVSGVANGVAQMGFDKDGIYYENPYTLDEVTVTAPDLRVAKAARDRQDAAGLGQFAAASAFGPAGLTAMLAANAMDHYIMRPATGQNWGSWMADKTGTAGGEFLGQPSEYWWGFTNPAGLAGGAALGASGNIFNANGGRGSYVRKTNPAPRIVPFEQYNPESYAEQAANHFRYKLGDVEINDPNVNYRQGMGIIRDFFENDGVRVAYPENELNPFAKSFDRPMFKQGGLWYGAEDLGAIPDLLTTREQLYPASKSAQPLQIPEGHVWPRSNGGRRIPLGDGQLNLSNTEAYEYVPDYGYQRVHPRETPDLSYYYKPKQVTKASPYDLDYLYDFVTQEYKNRNQDR